MTVYQKIKCKTNTVYRSIKTGKKYNSEKEFLEDIATLNPYKETKGVNKFKQAEEEGKLKFFVKDVEE